MKTSGTESIDIADEFDLPFNSAYSHQDKYQGDNAIYFYANYTIVRIASERSKMKEGVTRMLDVMTHTGGITDWQGETLRNGDYDIKFGSPGGALRGYYFRDINVAVMCDMTHRDVPDSRRMLAELTGIINEIRNEYLHIDEGDDK